jgi:uncharacterized protein involved in outer membrane biogenesis
MSTPTFWTSFRSSRWFKPALIVTGVVVLLIVALAASLLFDINKYHGQIVSQLEQRLGRKVNLGALSLRVFPSIRVVVYQAAIGEDPQFAQGDFVKAKSIRLQMGLGRLLRGIPQVEGIELVEPDVTLIKEKSGKWNWGTLKPLQSTEPDATEMAPFNLLVSDGRFTMVDRSVSDPIQRTYTGVNIALDNFSPRSAFDFTAAMTMPGGKAGRLEMSGTAGPIDRGDSANTPIDAHVKMDGVEIISLESLAGLQSPRSGRLTLDANVKGRITEGLSVEGKLAAEQLRLVADVEPSHSPLETTFKFTAKKQPTAETQDSDYTLKIDQGDLKIGKTRASLTGRIYQLASQPSIDLQIKGDQMALDSLLESAYAFGFGPPKGTNASGAATINLHATGSLSAIALNGQADLRELKFQSAGLPQAIEVPELKLACAPSAITALPFRATVGSRTTVEINALKLTNYTKQARVHLEVATSNAQVEDLIRIAESFGARPDIKGNGVATLKATVDANLGGSNLAMTINGQGKLSQAQFQASALKKPLEVSNADLTFTGNSARADNLNAQLGQSNATGWMQVKDFDQPEVNFDLKMNQLNVTEVQRSLALNEPLPAGDLPLQHAGSLSPIPKVMAQTKPAAPAKTSAASNPMKITANGQAAIGKVIVDNLAFTDVQSKVEFKDQILNLDPLSLNLYGGSYRGKARLDQRQKDTDVGLNGRISGMDLDQFIAAMMGQKSIIDGRTDATINIRGRGGNQFLNSLTGNGNLTIRNGRITSFDLMKQVEIFGKLAGLPAGGAGTVFRLLKTNFRLDRGKLTTNALQIVMDDLQVTGNGTMQLGNVVMTDYDLLAKLSPALSKRFAGGGDESESGAAGIRKLLGQIASVAGNFFIEQGSIVVPLRMSGPIREPSFGLNTAVIQKRATERFFGKPTEGFTKGKPQDAVKDILDLFKKKKKP